MGCGTSKDSVRIISSAHLPPPEVSRSAHYHTLRSAAPTPNPGNSSLSNPKSLFNQSLNQSYEANTTLQDFKSPRFNNFLRSADSSFQHSPRFVNFVKGGGGDSSFVNHQASKTPKAPTDVHETSVQNANLHQTASFQNSSFQNASFQNCSLQYTSFNNNSLLPEIGSEIGDDSLLLARNSARRVRMQEQRGLTPRPRHQKSFADAGDDDSDISDIGDFGGINCDKKSYADTKSIITSRTVMTTQSAISGRTKSTYLQRSTYDFNEYEAETRSPIRTPTTGIVGTQSRLEVFHQVSVRPPVVYGGNHFWWPSKRMLFNDYRHICELDNAVSQVQLTMGMDAKQLVARLKRHCEEEVDVARAIYRWIAHNITFRPETTPSRREPSALQVLQSGKGTAKGLCLLYQHLCSLANLQCELVEGLCKMVGFFPGVFEMDEMCHVDCPMYHAWIKIRLCRRWYLLDVALSRQGCPNDHGKGSPSHIAEEMFLPKPLDLINTHFPMSSQNEQLLLDPESQMLPDAPTLDLEWWAGSVVKTVACSEWGIKPLSHQRGVIESDENEVWLQFMCPNIMQYHVCLEAPELGVQYQGYALIYLQDDIVTAYMRLPGPGIYVVRLYAAPCYVKPGAEGLGCKLVMMYTIEATGAIVHLPFSSRFDGLWSITPQLYDSGCRVLSTKGAEIVAVDGRLSVDFRLPVDAIFPNLVWFCKAREEGVNLDGFVYAEREGRLARLHLLCPQPGEYILLFQVPVEDPTAVTRTGMPRDKSAYARFFITCQSPATTSEGAPSFPIFEHCLCGAFESIDNYGVWLPDQISSTLYAEQGCCQFLLRQDRPVRIVHSVQGENGTIHREASRWIMAERNGYDVIYHLRISEPGRYRVTLSAGEYDTSDLEIICVLMVDSGVAYSGDLFPECNTIWGVEPLFHELGLCCDLEELSKVSVKNGQAELAIRAKRETVLLPKLFHANDSSMDMAEYRVACRNDTEIVFYATIPFKGYYRLKITHNDQTVATYLLSCEVPAKPALPYEPFQSVYGITENFTTNGLKELGNVTSPIKIAQDGKCLIRHYAPWGFPVYFCLVQNNKQLKGQVYAERHRSEVHYYLEFENTGYHRFSCWSRLEDGKKDELLFSYLILNQTHKTESDASMGPYPELSEIWGLNSKGFILGVSVRNLLTSTIRTVDGMANFTMSYPAEVDVAFTLEHPDLTVQEAKRCIFVEHAANMIRHISVSLPVMGRYALRLSARKEGDTDRQSIGTFLILSHSEEPGAHSFPVYSNFYDGCKLGEPKINPLSAGTEYFFQLEIPGAKLVQLWDGVGRWRALLEIQEGGSIISGMVDVGDPKELWVAAMYDPEHPHGNGGFRDLLMFEVL